MPETLTQKFDHYVRHLQAPLPSGEAREKRRKELAEIRKQVIDAVSEASEGEIKSIEQRGQTLRDATTEELTKLQLSKEQVAQIITLTIEVRNQRTRLDQLKQEFEKSLKKKKREYEEKTKKQEGDPGPLQAGLGWLGGVGDSVGGWINRNRMTAAVIGGLSIGAIALLRWMLARRRNAQGEPEGGLRWGRVIAGTVLTGGLVWLGLTGFAQNAAAAEKKRKADDETAKRGKQGAEKAKKEKQGAEKAKKAKVTIEQLNKETGPIDANDANLNNPDINLLNLRRPMRFDLGHGEHANVAFEYETNQQIVLNVDGRKFRMRGFSRPNGRGTPVGLHRRVGNQVSFLSSTLDSLSRDGNNIVLAFEYMGNLAKVTIPLQEFIGVVRQLRHTLPGNTNPIPASFNYARHSETSAVFWKGIQSLTGNQMHLSFEPQS